MLASKFYRQLSVSLCEISSSLVQTSDKGKKKPTTLREKCPYSEFFWSVFSGIWTEYGEIQGISPYLV